MMQQNSQVPEKTKKVQKLEHVGSKGRTSKASMKTINATVGNKDSLLSTITTTPDVAVAATRMSSSMKKNNDNKDNLKSNDQPLTKSSSSIAVTNQTSTTFGSVRGVNSCVGNVTHESSAKVKDYSVKKFSNEIDSKLNNYQMQVDYKETSVTNQDYKSRSSNTMTNLPTRFSNQTSIQALHRENHMTFNVHSRPVSRNDNTAFAVARKALEQQNPVAKMAPINFPPLRAPQSIVNVRHPSVTEARIKHNEISGLNMKSKLNVSSSLQGGMKDLEHSRQTFHNYGTSQIAGIPNVQNLSNVTANISAYPRPDSFPQPTVASVLFPETAQFPQSPPFSTTQIGQLNQYQTYDPSSFATTPVSVNPVIPQFSAESSMPYPQYENPPQFVQPNHYPPADMASSQYQYQPPGVGQIQDSPMFIQSLQSPITVADQYAAAPNYARAVRAELMPRLRRPPRFNK
ncbi:uncharacterized protein LOC118448295 [Vespa mandarinia]|uniref:uncharacterized protein LOC118448295 n=1 Tax=Vespa mandarinia TaxID=7446 RepID=UPI0016171849|nr:uncharacterized protein LOC118448295 [Vespa mandarinia]